MRLGKLIFVPALLMLSLVLSAQGISFFKGTWEEALEAARQQDKLIFVDAYAVWCGPCKKMSATVFTDARVGAFHNQHFINLKLDMEAEESATFRQKHSVSAYPTLFYVNAEGEVVQKLVGALPVDALLQSGERALAKADPVEKYAAAYNNGDRDPALVYKYVRALIRSGQSHLRVANEYLRSQPDLSTEQNLRLLLLAATEADSRIFDLMTEQRAAIISRFGKETYERQVREACAATAKKAAEFQSADLLEQAALKMDKFSPDQAKAFRLEAQMDYSVATRNTPEYVKACREYQKKVLPRAAAVERLVRAKQCLQHFAADEQALELAEDLSREAAEAGTGYEYPFFYANVLLRRGKKAEALTAARRALELARQENPALARQVEGFISQIEG